RGLSRVSSVAPRLAMKSAAASLLISRARRYATSVIAGTGRTIGSRIFSRTRIVALCSASDELREANRNPESRRTAIVSSLLNHGAYRPRHGGSRPHARRYYPARLSIDRPLKATTLQPEKPGPHLWRHLRLRRFQADSPEAVEALGGVLRLAT